MPDDRRIYANCGHSGTQFCLDCLKELLDLHALNVVRLTAQELRPAMQVDRKREEIN